MKAISVRAPWWWFILHGGKDIENRDWPTRVRGRVLIHASKWYVHKTVVDDLWGHLDLVPEGSVPIAHPYKWLRERGGQIVGGVEITDCLARNTIRSKWFVGDYGFVLRDPVAFDEPIPFKGALGFFDVPDSLISGENNGSGISKAVPADGLHTTDRSEAPAAEVLFGRVPAERRPRAARDRTVQQTARALRTLQG